MPAAIEDRQRRIALIDTETAILDRETASDADHAARREELAAERQEVASEHTALELRWGEEKTLAAAITAARAEIEGDAPNKDAARIRLTTASTALRALQGEHPLIHPVVDGFYVSWPSRVRFQDVTKSGRADG